MKEQILAIERTDDLHSIRDKINRAQAGRLLLLWPILEEPLTRKLDLVLMRRWAANVASELIVISADPEVQRLARQAGVRFYPTLTASALAALSPSKGSSIPKIPVRPRRAKSPPPPRRCVTSPAPPALRILLFATAILSLVIAVLLVVPSAKVVASFPFRKLEATVPLAPTQCETLSTQISLADRQITTGRIFAPITFAEGAVLLKNISDRTLNLPAGLRISSETGVVFEAIQGLILTPGQSRSIGVRALEPGSGGNLEPGVLHLVEGPLALSLEATNPKAISGGASVWREAVAEEDLKSLRAGLSDRVRQEAEDGLRKIAGRTKTIAQDSLRVDFEPQDEPEYAIRTPVETVGLTLHANASALACPNDILAEAAWGALKARLQSAERLFPDGITIKLKSVSSTLILEAAGQASKIPDAQEVMLALRLQTPAQASTLLRDRFGAMDITTVAISPSWIPFLPLFPFRMEFIAAAGEQPAP